MISYAIVAVTVTFFGVLTLSNLLLTLRRTRTSNRARARVRGGSMDMGSTAVGTHKGRYLRG